MIQPAKKIMMVRPKHFGFDPASAESNAFQHKEGAEQVNDIATEAIAEFDAAVTKLRANGLEVLVIQDTDKPEKPNAVFPNNWISFHENQVLIYPMMAENRRWERRDEILDEVLGESEKQIIDLTEFEKESKFLESTGSVVIDYVNDLAYACISARTDQDVLEKMCEVLKLEPILFEAVDKEGLEIYHTNVMMCLAADYAVICLESIKAEYRDAVVAALTKTGHQLIKLSMDQIYHFAGNMMETLDESENSVLVMSDTAMKSLTIDQKETVAQFSQTLSIHIPTIEKYGGGSARCMMCRVE